MIFGLQRHIDLRTSFTAAYRNIFYITLGGVYELAYQHLKVIGGQEDHDVHHGALFLWISCRTFGWKPDHLWRQGDVQQLC